VEGGVGHAHARHLHRLQARDRCECTCAAHLDLDVEDPRQLLLGRELAGDGPAGARETNPMVS
jgi:hypothetical protein